MRMNHLLLSANITLAPLSIARAGDEDNLNERVDAAACQTRQSSDRSKLVSTGSDWAFAPGAQGTVVLECPIFTDWEDDTAGTRQLDELRLWYRDSDGTGNHARVQADLRLIDPSGGVIASISEGSVDSNGSVTTTSTTRTTSLGGVDMMDAQYFVVVTMFRDDTSKTVLFRGVSFFEE